MSRNERFREILGILKSRNYLTIDELSRHFFVSPSTMRRDLAEMEKCGYLTRIRGGATAVQTPRKGEVIFPREMNNLSKSQQAIVKQTAALIRNGDIIFLDTSRMSVELTAYLQSKQELTIVTNNLSLISSLEESRHRIFCCAGRLDVRRFATLGEISEETALSFNYDKAVIGCSDIAGGYVACHSMEEASLLKVALSRARVKILMYSDENAALTPPCNVVPIQNFDVIVTDSIISDALSEEQQILFVE